MGPCTSVANTNKGGGLKKTNTLQRTVTYSKGATIYGNRENDQL
jgi:hypothetical protein